MEHVLIEKYSPELDSYWIHFLDLSYPDCWAKYMGDGVSGGARFENFRGLASRVNSSAMGDDWFIVGIYIPRSEETAVRRYVDGSVVYWAGEDGAVKLDADGETGLYGASIGKDGGTRFTPGVSYNPLTKTITMNADQYQEMSPRGTVFGEIMRREGLNGARISVREFKLNSGDFAPMVRELISHPYIPFIDKETSSPKLTPINFSGAATYDLSAGWSKLPISPWAETPVLPSKKASFLLGAIKRRNLQGFNLLAGNVNPGGEVNNLLISPIFEIWGGKLIGSQRCGGISGGQNPELKAFIGTTLDGGIVYESAGTLALGEIRPDGSQKHYFSTKYEIANKAKTVSFQVTNKGVDIKAKNSPQSAQGMARGETIAGALDEIIDSMVDIITNLGTVAGVVGPPAAEVVDALVPVTTKLTVLKAKLHATPTMPYSITNTNN